MFDAIASRYELVNKLMTFGLDARWRRRAVVDLRLPRASVVLDVAAGTGDFTRELARQGHRAVATDLSFGMLRAGKEMNDRVQADASSLPFRAGGFDGVTCGYALRNFSDLAATFDEMARVTRPGGRLSLLEVCRTAIGDLARRVSRVVSTGRALHRLTGLGPRRLPLPPRIHGVPARQATRSCAC